MAEKAKRARKIRRPEIRPAGSSEHYDRTTVMLPIDLMRKVRNDARRKNKTVSMLLEVIISGAYPDKTANVDIPEAEAVSA